MNISSEDYIEKVKQMTIAYRLCNFGFTEEQVHLLIALYEAVGEKGGEFTVREAISIKFEVNAHYLTSTLPKDKDSQ